VTSSNVRKSDDPPSPVMPIQARIANAGDAAGHQRKRRCPRLSPGIAVSDLVVTAPVWKRVTGLVSKCVTDRGEGAVTVRSLNGVTPRWPVAVTELSLIHVTSRGKA